MLSPCRKDEVADPDSLDTPLEKNASLFIKIKIIIKYIFFIISLSDHLKLSIDIFIMSVRHVFAQLQFIFKKRSCLRPRQKEHHVCFLCFIKATCLLILWVHTNKGRPFTVPNYVLLSPLSEKNNGVGNFKLFPLKKMHVIALVPPCPEGGFSFHSQHKLGYRLAHINIIPQV